MPRRRRHAAAGGAGKGGAAAAAAEDDTPAAPWIEDRQGHLATAVAVPPASAKGKAARDKGGRTPRGAGGNRGRGGDRQQRQQQKQDYVVLPPEPKGKKGDREKGSKAAGASGERRHEGFLDEETLSYFAQVETMLDRDAFPEDEDRAIFVANVHKEIAGKQWSLMAHHDCSRVLEKLVQVSTPEQLNGLLSSVAGKYVKAMTTRHSSHVLQTLLAAVAHHLDRHAAAMEGAAGAQPLPAELAEALTGQVIAMADEVLPEVSGLAKDTYGSHVLQSLLCALSGHAETEVMRSKRSREYRRKADENVAALEAATKPAAAPDKLLHVPKAFSRKFKEMQKALVPVPSEDGVSKGTVQRIVRDMAMDQHASPLLQLFMRISASQKSNYTKKLVDLLLDDADAEEGSTLSFAAAILLHPVGSHVLETLLEIGDSALFMRLYTTLFRGRLYSLSTDNVGTFVVAKLFASAHTTGQLEMLSDEVYPHLPEIIADNRLARLLTALTSSMVRLSGSNQKQLITELMRALHCQAPSQRRHFFTALLYWRPQPSQPAAGAADADDAKATESDAPQPTVGGSLVIQNLWKFGADAASTLAESFLAISIDDFVRLAKTFPGSRAIEGFFGSAAPLAAKNRVLRRLNGHYAELAVDKYGSHIVDAAWRASDLNQKTAIAGELANREGWVATSFYGQMALRNCNVDKFKRRRQEWTEAEEARERKAAMFADLLADEEKATEEAAMSGKKRKRGADKANVDEIDQLFDAETRGKKPKARKDAASAAEEMHDESGEMPLEQAKKFGMDDIFDAISKSKNAENQSKKKK